MTFQADRNQPHRMAAYGGEGWQPRRRAMAGELGNNVRAGEERQVAAAPARIGVPILRSISGRSLFEGADAAWITPKKVMVGRGIRTNMEAINQMRTVLGEMGVDVDELSKAAGSIGYRSGIVEREQI